MADKSGDGDQSIAASQARLDRLLELHPKKIDLSLGRMKRLLAALGHPEKKLPPVIQVAGTNGKGSTTAMMRAMFEASGRRVHVYTSPHLCRFHERIRVAGKLISEDKLCDVLDRTEQANAGAEITFFEITTAAAFLAFAETAADVCLLEVGLGGRLDATNVLDHVALSVITPISLDHKEFLGDTVEAIATEKAGIFKKDCPALIAPQVKLAEQAIKAAAKKRGADAYFFGSDWHMRALDKERIQISDDLGSVSMPRPPLPGSHQAVNAAVAVAAMRLQTDLETSESAIKAGLGWVRWPARLQNLAGSRYADLLPEGSDLWLDGGHNEAASQAIKTFLQRFDPVEQPVSLILGMMGNKDAHAFLKPLQSHITQVIAVPVPGEAGGAAPAELAATASDLGIKGTLAKDVASALVSIASKARAETPPVVMILGSLYLAGDVLRQNDLLPD